MRRFPFLLLVVLGITAACDRESMLSPENKDENTSNAKIVKVKAGGAGTRTSIEEVDGQFKFHWLKGDKLAIWEAVPSLVNSDEYVTQLYESEGLPSDTDEAVFTLKLGERESLGNTIQYVALYPKSSEWDNIDCWDYELGRMIIPINFPDTQHPSADSFDPDADVLVSRIVNCSARPDELSFSFARVGAIIKMVVKGLPQGAVITGGSLDPGIEASYYCSYDPERETIVASDGAPWIIFNYGDEGLTVGEDGSATIWLRSMSGVSRGFEVQLEGKNGLYLSRKVSLAARGKKLDFKEGGLTTFSVTFANPDVSNPEPESIDYFTNEAMDGVTVYWPESIDTDYAGYECFIRGENGERIDFDSFSHTDSGLYKAIISGGIDPGIYTLYVKTIATEGKVSELEYAEKELSIGIPISTTISYSAAYNPYNPDWGLSLSGPDDYDTGDYYSGLIFTHRNLSWGSGSPTPILGQKSQKDWAIWNESVIRWVEVSIALYDPKEDYLINVYSSDDYFAGGVPTEGQLPLSYTTVSEDYYKYYVYDMGGKNYFLITDNKTTRIHEIILKYYK